MATRILHVLTKKASAAYSSESIVFGENKFKIVASNGNAYSRLEIYIYTRNGDLGLIAEGEDVPGYAPVDYIDDNEKRQLGNAKNIRAAEEYIKLVY